jgi:SulP family sulfate permease
MADGSDISPDAKKERSLKKFFPFLRWRQMVTRRSLRADIVAGITGAIIVLPQGVAFAIIAGLPPEYGLYSAIVPAIIPRYRSLSSRR